MVNSRNISDQTADTELRILEAATKVFREKGREGARMQEIADAAGINKALLHYYFRSKDLLFERVFMDSAQQYFANLNDILKSDVDIFSKIRYLCEAYITMTSENPFIPVFIIGEMHRSEDDFIRKMFSVTRSKPDFAVFSKQLEESVDKGLIRPIAPHQLIMHILGLCIFPVIAKPMMQFNMGIGEREFKAMMEERKQLVPELILSSLKKKKK